MFVQRTIRLLLLVVTITSISSCYQYVRFISNPSGIRKLSNSRNSRSFADFYPITSTFPELWPEELLWTNGGHILEYTIGSHDSPPIDTSSFNHFDNEVHDPFLATSSPSHLAYILSKGLYFNDIPHVKSLLHNQDIRRRNGLSGNKLGSLRPTSPFYRKSHYQTRR